MARVPSTSVAIRQFQSETDLICATPVSKAVSWSMWILIGILVAALVATVTVRVDKIVTSSNGKIVSVAQVNVVQALDPSIIKSIDVHEGDTVQKGQVLATLDPTLTNADLNQLNQQVEGLKAQIARANAEKTRTVFNPLAKAGDKVASYLTLQKGLFDRRAAEYAAKTHSFDEQMQQQQATLVKMQGDESRYKERLAIAQKVEGMNDALVKSGSNSLLNLLVASDARLEAQRIMTYTHNGLLETQHQIAGLQADRDAYAMGWFSELTQEIVTAQNALDLAQAQLAKAALHQDLVHMAAKEPGVVLSVDKLSVGSVLKQGDELMTVMPLGTPLQAEANIPSRDIGFLRVGDPARLKVDAFNSAEHGYAEGKIAWISEDAFTLDANGNAADAYYKARISVEGYHFTGLPPNFRLIPGMTLTADINVGSRLLGRYLIGGALRGSGESMRDN